MDNVSKTNNIVRHRFTVTPCANELTGKSGARTDAKLAGELVNVTNDTVAVTSIKAEARRKRAPVTLMYGFVGVRDLARTKNVNKITIDLLNRALTLAHGNLSAGKLSEVRQGIQVRDSAVRQFAQATRIDDIIARYLLHSWSAYLQREYNFISIQSTLRKRAAKSKLCNNKDLKYLVKKNHAMGPKLDATDLKGIKFIIDKFITEGDNEGFIALQNNKSHRNEQVAGIFSSMFFRRTSKLGLKWSRENNVPVYFDMDFTHKQAIKKCRDSYQPITFSEYKYYKKYQFENVTERQFLTQESPFYLQCLGIR